MNEAIHGEALCNLTGLTDRRHRQLAKEGYFPNPVDGFYERDAAIRGVIKFYQERDKKSKARGVKAQIEAEKLKAHKLKNAEAEEKMTETAALLESVTSSLASFRDLVYQKFEQEAPTAMVGLDVPSARIIGKRMAGEMCDKLQTIFKVWPI